MRYVGTIPEPLAVSVADFKARTHVMAGDTGDDTPFEAVLRAAQSAVTTATGRPTHPDDWEFTVEADGWCRYYFPLCPVTEVTKIEIPDAAGDWVEQDLTGIKLIMPHDRPQLILPAPYTGEDVHSVRITATCGFEAGRLPEALAQSIMMQAKEWHDHQITIEPPAGGLAVPGMSFAPRLSIGIRNLISQWRYRRAVITETS